MKNLELVGKFANWFSTIYGSDEEVKIELSGLSEVFSSKTGSEILENQEAPSCFRQMFRLSGFYQMKFPNKLLIIAAIAMLLAVGCGSQKTATSTTQNTPERRSQQGGPPSFAQLLTEMDANNDGKLSKSEVTGPLQNDFSKIDSNSDGFITQAEVENAPKPQRGQGPPRG